MQFPSTPPFNKKLTSNANTIRRRFKYQKAKPQKIYFKVNEAIRAFRVLVIDESEKNLGEMPVSEALAIAREQDLDLIEVSPRANPPVCRIMDYGKFLYQQSKQKKESKTKQKKVEIKGIRIGIRTDEHDINFKKIQTEKFLKKGNKVKIEIVLRGREKAHQDLARDTLRNFIKRIEAAHKIEEDIKRFPGGFNVIIAPE